MPQDLKNFLMGFKGSNDPESVNSMKNVSNNRLRIEVHLVMEGNTVIKHTYAAYWALPKEESVSGPETKPGGKN